MSSKFYGIKLFQLFISEHYDESGYNISLLKVKIQNQVREALIDTGAQCCCMKTSTAKELMLSHLIDDQFSGIMQGVGSQRFIGKIHLVKLEVDGMKLSNAFYILDEMPVDICIGWYKILFVRNMY